MNFKAGTHQLVFTTLLFLLCISASGQNPFVTHMYTADPTARVFNDTLYVYPSSDTICATMTKTMNGFCMPGYHVFSTTDMTNWTDHGNIINDYTVPWVEPGSKGMWAPDCVEKDGKYYHYFPAVPKDSSSFRRTGVAIADHPTGPFIPEENYIKDLGGIDPNVLIDDGKIYMYVGVGQNIMGVEMNPDMVSIKGKPQVIKGMPAKYKEGPFAFKYKGLYYMTFPHAPDGSEEIAYATSTNPLGPYEYKGKIMDRWTDGCWTNHHSIVEYKGQWYIFYHHMDLSKDQHLRSVMVDRLYFNEDGSIKHVPSTLRGVGYLSAAQTLQIDRHTEAKDAYVSKKQPNVVNWTLQNIKSDAVVRFNDIDFGKGQYENVAMYLSSSKPGGKVTISNDKGVVISKIDVPVTGREKWLAVKAKVETKVTGMQNLIFKFTGTTQGLGVDWIRFIPKKKALIVLGGNAGGTAKLEGTFDLDASNRNALINPKAFNVGKLKLSKSDKSYEQKFLQNGEQVELSKIKGSDVINIVYAKPVKKISGNSRIPARKYTGQKGVQVEQGTEAEKNIGYVENGDFIYFESVDFKKSVKKADVRVASNGKGGTLEIRLGSEDGELLASVPVKKTNGWQNWETLSSKLSKELKGEKSIYLVFKGEKGYLFNVSWVEFK